MAIGSFRAPTLWPARLQQQQRAAVARQQMAGFGWLMFYESAILFSRALAGGYLI